MKRVYAINEHTIDGKDEIVKSWLVSDTITQKQAYEKVKFAFGENTCFLRIDIKHTNETL